MPSPNLTAKEQAWLKYPQDLVWRYDTYIDFLEDVEDERLFISTEEGGLGYLQSEPLTYGQTYPLFNVSRTEAGHQAYKELVK